MNQRIPLLSQQEAEQRLSEHAEAASTVRRGVAWKQSTAFVASNDPIEDANASKIIARDPSEKSPAGDFMFFTVMDGHGGYHTSRLLSKILIPAVALGIDSLISQPTSFVPKVTGLSAIKAILWPTQATPTKPFDADPKYMSLAIQRAFSSLDADIIDAPLRVLAEVLGLHLGSCSCPW